MSIAKVKMEIVVCKEQVEAVIDKIIEKARTREIGMQSNLENTVGVMKMAGKGIHVLVTPTSDLGKILACMHELEVGAEANLAAAIQVAQLALKDRQNKRQQQRIIL